MAHPLVYVTHYVVRTLDGSITVTTFSLIPGPQAYGVAYGLAELFATDTIAKRLVLQLPLHTYVYVEALSLQW